MANHPEIGLATGVLIELFLCSIAHQSMLTQDVELRQNYDSQKSAVFW